MFASGEAVLPDKGMEGIPRQLAGHIPSERLRVNTKVTELRGSQVSLETGENISADHIVLATDLNDAFRLMNIDESLDYHPVICLYYRAHEVPDRGAFLYLNGTGKCAINNLCIVTDVSPSYGNGKDQLVSVTVLDGEGLLDHELEQMVYGDLKEWFGTRVDLWELIKIYRIPAALPPQSRSPLPQLGLLKDKGYYFCGDYWHFASINAAMKSGNDVANRILGKLQK